MPKASSQNAREAPSACIYENHRHEISKKVCIDFGQGQISLFLCLESISKVVSNLPDNDTL